MAQSRRNTRVPRATRAQRVPTPPASPPREEVVQEAATPNTIHQFRNHQFIFLSHKNMAIKANNPNQQGTLPSKL